MTNLELVQQLWRAIEAREWQALELLCSEELTYTLPQSGEVHDRAGFIKMNQQYPGEWHASIERLIDGGDFIVAEVIVAFPDRRDIGISICRCAGGAIVEIREYWPEPFPVPDWRLGWAQNLEKKT